jgi:GPI biosynthesis protein family Pig-F
MSNVNVKCHSAMWIPLIQHISQYLDTDDALWRLLTTVTAPSKHTNTQEYDNETLSDWQSQVDTYTLNKRTLTTQIYTDLCTHTLAIVSVWLVVYTLTVLYTPCKCRKKPATFSIRKISSHICKRLLRCILLDIPCTIVFIGIVAWLLGASVSNVQQVQQLVWLCVGVAPILIIPMILIAYDTLILALKHMSLSTMLAGILINTQHATAGGTGSSTTHTEPAVFVCVCICACTGLCTWLSAIVLPLDWELSMLQYPTAPICGAYIGHMLGCVIATVLVLLRSLVPNRRQHTHVHLQ